jgi:hypothetical protein
MKKTKAEQVEATIPSTLGQNNWKVSIWRNSMTGKIQVVAREGRTVATMYNGRKVKSWQTTFGPVDMGGDRQFTIILDAPRLTEKLATLEVAKMKQRLIDGGFATDGAINEIMEGA